MNRELAEVRRYWPRARVQWRDEESTRYCVQWRDEESTRYCAPGAWCIVRADSVSTIVRDWSGRESRIRTGAPTIAEAMRAAGFGTRRLGEFARAAMKRQEYRQRIIESGRCGPTWTRAAARLLAYYLPQLADRQRPRKGVRLGRRKRSGADKEDARQFAQWREAQP